MICSASLRQIVAIHEADPTVLVTVGSASEHSVMSNAGFFDYWSDRCLEVSLRNHRATPRRFIDFYQVHIYPIGPKHNLTWQPTAPFFGGGRPKSEYKLDRPLVLGEFPAGHTVAHRNDRPWSGRHSWHSWYGN